VVLKVIWNTDRQQTSLSRAWPSFTFGRGMVHSKWGYKQPKYHMGVLKCTIQFIMFLHMSLKSDSAVQ